MATMIGEEKQAEPVTVFEVCFVLEKSAVPVLMTVVAESRDVAILRAAELAQLKVDGVARVLVRPFRG